MLVTNTPLVAGDPIGAAMPALPDNGEPVRGDEETQLGVIWLSVLPRELG